jgi:replicative superfamily II helicase
MAVAGTLGARQAEVRFDLRSFDLTTVPSRDRSWAEQVSHRVAIALALLVRKADGWRDVRLALQRIAELRSAQESAETPFLSEQGDDEAQTQAAGALVVWYHLAQIVTLAGEYLRDGASSQESISTSLDRHRDRALQVASEFHLTIVGHTAGLVWACARALVAAAIWSHVRGLGEQVRAFARNLVSEGRQNPIIELWPSQQQALRQNVLTTYHRAILVEMPTSAGKTLLAKFSIVQTKALNPNGVVMYLAPTRALVNQVTLELRQDFQQLQLSVEQTVPAFELDPTEESLLNGVSDVLVTTPEKLDLLVRRNHPVTRNIALVVVDEAHTLADSLRGARLELLLGMLKRERPDARFLLLSPFLPKGDELTQWLGDDRALPPIVVRWEPSNKVVAAARNDGRGRAKRLVLETLPSTDNIGVAPGRIVVLGPPASAESKTAVSQAAVAAMRERGSVLVLCKGRGTAEKRAGEIAEASEERSTIPDVDAVCRYLQAEAGEELPLVQYIKRGVAYHHAGLSPEARWLVESLIRRGHVNVVCGTTTLAAGVNYPITTVIVETLKKGTTDDLKYSDFWNIAGRAGRALVDAVGVVAFPARNHHDVDDYKTFLEGEAEEIASQLTRLLTVSDDLASRFSMQIVDRYPEFGSFLQFLAHAMRVAGSTDLADDVEDLLRSTLVFRQALRADPTGAWSRKLVAVAHAYLTQIRGQRGIVELADQTGFATPSVLYLQARIPSIPRAKDRGSWQPSVLFGSDIRPLTDRIAAVASIPEIKLGVGHRQPFNAQRIAEILRDWVNGSDLSELAKRYPIPTPQNQEDDRGEAITRFSQYLFGTLLGRASWGLGALEGLSLAGIEPPAAGGDEAYVPAMVFFGVRRKEAVWLRMVGVPRMVADPMGAIWETQRGGPPQTYAEVRNWVNAFGDEQWRSVIPRGSVLTPDAARRVWAAFSGEAAPATDVA